MMIQELVTRLVASLAPEAIYLFGSRARGDADPDSDIDVLVVVSASDLPGHVRDRMALKALRGLGAAIDIVVLTRAEFDRRRSVVCSLPATVEREGKQLYAA